MFLVILGRKIAIITDAFDHKLDIKNVTVISVGKTPMGRLLEALNSKEVDVSEYKLFILILGYNLELDTVFWNIL